jgi:hypothetical protein
MPGPRVRTVPAQAQPQPSSPVAFAVPAVRAANGHINIRGPQPTIGSLQANVIAATILAGSCDSVGSVGFSTNAVVPAGTQLFVITFAVRWQTPPVVVVGGGPQFVNAFEAVNTTAARFSVFSVLAVGNAAGQGLQWIAIGNDPVL